MQIKFDQNNNEYYLSFLDDDDRRKKSKFLKLLLENGTTVVTMSILENESVHTKSQWGMYEAFVYLLREYTGDEISEVKATIYSFLNINEDEIKKYNKKQFSDFIERLFQMCAENIGIEVQQVGHKLTIVRNEK